MSLASLARRVGIVLAVCAALLFGSAMLAPAFHLPTLDTAVAGAAGCDNPPGQPGDVRINPDTGAIMVCQDYSDPRSPTRDYRWGPLRPGPVPAVSPSWQTTRACAASWTVTVARNPSLPENLRVNYGDGTSETRSISPGSGSVRLLFSHTFAGYTDGRTFVQQFTVLQNGRYVRTTTVHSG